MSTNLNASRQASSSSYTIAWGILAIAVLANIAGYMFNLYNQFWWFDEVLHGYTIFAITLLLGLLAYGNAVTGVRNHEILVVLMIASIGLAIGALWEVAEWAYDMTVASNAILGKTDTIIDLIMDTVGALLAGFLCLSMLKK